MATARTSGHCGPKSLPRWRVTLIAAKSRPLGTVRAASADAAVKEAAEIFGITDPGHQRRLVATRILEKPASSEDR